MHSECITHHQSNWAAWTAVYDSHITFDDVAREGWRGGGRDWSTAVLCEFVAAVVESNSESRQL